MRLPSRCLEALTKAFLPPGAIYVNARSSMAINGTTSFRNNSADANGGKKRLGMDGIAAGVMATLRYFERSNMYECGYCVLF